MRHRHLARLPLPTRRIRIDRDRQLPQGCGLLRPGLPPFRLVPDWHQSRLKTPSVRFLAQSSAKCAVSASSITACRLPHNASAPLPCRHLASMFRLPIDSCSGMSSCAGPTVQVKFACPRCQRKYEGSSLYSYGLYSCGLYSCGLYSYDLYSYGLYSYGPGTKATTRANSNASAAGRA